MNYIFLIAIIIAFYLIGEFITWYDRKENNICYIYTRIIQFFVIVIAVLSIWKLDYNLAEYEECCSEFEKLQDYQTTMIDSLANHLWREHSCDVPMYDGDLIDKIHEQEHILDSIYYEYR